MGNGSKVTGNVVNVMKNAKPEGVFNISPESICFEY